VTNTDIEYWRGEWINANRRIRELEELIRQQEPKPCEVCKYSKKDKTCEAHTIGYGSVVNCNFELKFPKLCER